MGKGSILEAFWFMWSNGDASRLYVEYPEDLKHKPDELAKFLEKDWLRYPCIVTYRGRHKAALLPELRSFFIDLKREKTSV